MSGDIIKPDAFNGNAPEPKPDGIKARERLIVESARTLVCAMGISKDIDDGHDDFMELLQQVRRLTGATSDEWNWPEAASFSDLESDIHSVKNAAHLLFVVWEAIKDPAEKAGFYFLAQSVDALADRLNTKFNAAWEADRIAGEDAS